MTEEQLTLKQIRDYIASLPLADREKILQIAEVLRDIVNRNVGHGVMALSLVGAELATA